MYPDQRLRHRPQTSLADNRVEPCVQSDQQHDIIGANEALVDHDLDPVLYCEYSLNLPIFFMAIYFQHSRSHYGSRLEQQESKLVENHLS